jgi:hypothetical protein
MSEYLSNHLLIALPALADATFAQRALVCQHDEDGAMGVLVNQPSEYTLGEVLAQMGIPADGELRGAHGAGRRAGASRTRLRHPRRRGVGFQPDRRRPCT